MAITRRKALPSKISPNTITPITSAEMRISHLLVDFLIFIATIRARFLKGRKLGFIYLERTEKSDTCPLGARSYNYENCYRVHQKNDKSEQRSIVVFDPFYSPPQPKWEAQHRNANPVCRLRFAVCFFCLLTDFFDFFTQDIRCITIELEFVDDRSTGRNFEPGDLIIGDVF